MRPQRAAAGVVAVGLVFLAIGLVRHFGHFDGGADTSAPSLPSGAQWLSASAADKMSAMATVQPQLDRIKRGAFDPSIWSPAYIAGPALASYRKSLKRLLHFKSATLISVDTPQQGDSAIANIGLVLADGRPYQLRFHLLRSSGIYLTTFVDSNAPIRMRKVPKGYNPF